MKNPLRIAHTSDIHLDTDYYGGETNLSTRDYYRGVFDRLLIAIAAEEPDVLMLPGDLFDSNRASVDTILWAMEHLGKLPFPVLMIPGNHDCLEEESIFRRHDFGIIANVQMLTSETGETRELPELGIQIWGKGMVDHSPEFRPLDGLAAPREGWWNLGMGHGIYVGNNGNAFRSSPVEAKQIAESGYDYIALGHHHALLEVSNQGTKAFYCGAPVPISPEGKGTYVIVNLAEGQESETLIRSLD